SRPLALGVLRTLARLAQTDLLALDLAGVAGHETGLAQRATQGFVVGDQCAGDAMANGAGLTGDAATQNGDVDVELLGVLGQFQRLANHHARGFTTEEVLQGAVVDGDLASTRTQEDASGSGLATASAVVLSRR